MSAAPRPSIRVSSRSGIHGPFAPEAMLSTGHGGCGVVSGAIRFVRPNPYDPQSTDAAPVVAFTLIVAVVAPLFPGSNDTYHTYGSAALVDVFDLGE
jgi:hypothetical protein